MYADATRAPRRGGSAGLHTASSVEHVSGLRGDYIERPHPSRFTERKAGFEAAMARHAHAVTCGLSTYRDPATGYTVLTAVYLAERGYCCNAGCRHCPYLTAPDLGAPELV
jgi:Family of unknown function (DUF5522)